MPRALGQGPDVDANRSIVSNQSLLTREEKHRNVMGLWREAWEDVKRGSAGILSPFDGNFKLDFGHEVAAIAAVFLAINLGYKKVVTVRQDPEPLMIAGLCFFSLDGLLDQLAAICQISRFE